MSLFGSIQLANNALHAQQIGLQVVGQNIANANTPGYIREKVNFAPAPTQQVGGVLLGMGVQVLGVRQVIDRFLEDRLRGATSDRAGSEVQQQAFQQLEGLVNELGDNDLSTSMNSFFSSVSDVLNRPGDVSTRNLAVLKGTTLAQDMNNLSTRAQQQRSDLNDQVTKMSDDVNRLIEQVRKLNGQIAVAEGSTSSHSDAVGLRDQRQVALSDLSELIDIRVDEQPSGDVNVYSGGDYLVFGRLSRQVETAESTDRGTSVSNIRFADSKAPLDTRGGKLAGLLESRDGIVEGFIDRLDDLAKTLAFEFNRVYSSGQGLKGFNQLTSNTIVTQPSAPLDAAGLAFTPQNGSFQVKVLNTQTKSTKTYDVAVNLAGLSTDTTLASLANQLNSIDGLSASVSADGRLSIKSTAAGQQFSFANDNSGALAALGLNTFFTGATALSLGVDSNLRNDPSLFAASTTGIGSGTDNALKMAAFLTRPLESKNGATIQDEYSRLVGDLTQSSTEATATSQGFSTYEQALIGQKNAISGVSLDEEAVNMLSYQRAFQASAKYIATLNELLGIMVDL